MTELINVVTTLDKLPFTTMLVLILVGGYRGWWIYGPTAEKHRQEVATDRDEWKKLALSLTGVAEVAVRGLETTSSVPKS